MGINGAIILNKEKGISSFSAVKSVKRIIGVDKAGHTGTLDPMAEGVLVVCLGKHTKLSEYLVSKEKTYQVEMLLGFSTKTYDLEGEVDCISNPSNISSDDIKNTVLSFNGVIEQTPPVYSAIKVNGRKLYDYARKGMEVKIPSRIVELKDISDISISDYIYNEISVKKICYSVTCSKGTYIRSLCSDIGKKLNTYGTMSGLIRTKNGSFSINNSYKIVDIQKYAQNKNLTDIIINPIPYVGLKKIQLNEQQSENYMKGIKLKYETKKGDYIVILSSGISVGICTVDDNNLLKSRKRLI